MKLNSSRRSFGGWHFSVTVVGTPDDIDHVEHFFGNSVKTLSEPNIGSIFLGMLLGLAIGVIPISLPGIHQPVRLGVAGGPIIMGIIVGALGPRMHFISYTTRSASLKAIISFSAAASGSTPMGTQ